jgi:hypothetical protein
LEQKTNYESMPILRIKEVLTSSALLSLHFIYTALTKMEEIARVDDSVVIDT